MFQPWHWVTIPAIGIVHGEIFYLEELAADCAADRVYEFAYVATTNAIRGSVAGTALRPIALR